MGRRLTVTLATALLIFVLAPMVASADEITTPSGILIIPDGSQVTSVFVLPPIRSISVLRLELISRFRVAQAAPMELETKATWAA